jgi:pyridoxal phosphate phosphatase PHOSPHO2
MSEQTHTQHHQATGIARPLLLIFDFDHTLCDVNSDLVPFNELSYGKALIPRFTTLRKEQGMGWTQIMQSQLAELAIQEGYSKAGLLECIRNVKMDTGLVHALKTLHKSSEPPVRMVIASDANTIFISEILAANDIDETTFASIYTNEGSWSANDVLQVEPYQSPDTPHECPRGCPVNMCKTAIKKRAMEELGLANAENLRIVYIGDGGNDFCPSLSLKQSDLVFARDGFALQKLIEKGLAVDPAEQPATGPPASEDSAGDQNTSSSIPADESSTLQLSQKVMAEVRLWNAHNQLGQMLLGLIGPEPLPPKSDSKPSRSIPIIDDIDHGIAQMAISKESHI